MHLKPIFFDKNELTPSKVICVGRNYVEHIKELNNQVPTQPVIFLKPNSAISHAITIDPSCSIHYEAEICFLIIDGTLKGVGFGLDLTKRELQTQLKNQGLPWERAKAFDHSAVFSKFTTIPDDIRDISLELWINSSLVQEANFDLMIHKPKRLLEDIASFMTCLDGDILMTGTPKGVGKVKPGDTYIGKVFSKNTLLIEAHWEVHEPATQGLNNIL